MSVVAVLLSGEGGEETGSVVEVVEEVSGVELVSSDEELGSGDKDGSDEELVSRDCEGVLEELLVSVGGVEDGVLVLVVVVVVVFPEDTVSPDKLLSPLP